jgi:hypothetical protein
VYLRPDRLLYAAALCFGALPLWVCQHLPVVDLPQHLHLISVLHRLDDPTTLYPQLFEARGQLTPYLGYYHLVSLLHWLLPLRLANTAFLTAYAIGFPLSLAYLLRALGRPTWPSLLAIPFVYGDSFGWGFINYCSALPLTLLCCGLFIRTIDQPARRRAYAGGVAVTLVAVLLFHVQAFAFLGLALPFLLLTTPAPGPGFWRPRLWALAAVVPGVLLFLIWVGGRLGEPAQVEAGAPWKAWGPLLSPQNLSYKSFAQNRDELIPVLANLLRDGSDRYAVYAAIAVGAIGLILGLLPELRAPSTEGKVARWRLAGLTLIALALYFALPFDIRGYMYYLNTRFAHLVAPLALALAPALQPRVTRVLTAAGAAVALLTGFVLASGFRAFNAEAAELDPLVQATAPGPRVMGLIFDPSSKVMTHPVFLHASTVLARERGGVTNFSFALTPHSPLKYRGEPPPTFPSEWRPDQFRWNEHGAAYDHFLVRGVHPSQLFGPLLQSELGIAAESGNSWLVRRRR